MNRIALIEATEALMCEEGYAAVSSRRVAERAGLKQQLVYYYFRTMDDLLLATFQRSCERIDARIEDILAADQPLRALLELLKNPIRSNLSMEYMALGNHNALVRAEIVRFSEHLRERQYARLAARLPPPPEGSKFSTTSLAMYVMHCVSQILHWEQALGISAAHTEARAFLEQLVNELEPPVAKTRRRGALPPVRSEA